MDALIWMTGYAGSDVEHREVGELVFASFRLACTPRVRRNGEWLDGETTWIGVTCSRALADNVRTSLHKGDPVIVVGRLRTQRWADKDGELHERLTLAAEAVGHDLNRGTAGFVKNQRQAVERDPVGEIGELVLATETQPEEDDEESTAVA